MGDRTIFLLGGEQVLGQVVYHMVIVTPCPSKECVGFYSRFLEGTGAFTNSCPILECKENFPEGEERLWRKCEVQLTGPVDGIDWSDLGLYQSWFIRFEPETKLILFSRARIEVNKR